MVYPARKSVGDWTDDLPSDYKTCGAAFCQYPERECVLEFLNEGAVDADDFIWIDGGELCKRLEG